jgi:demethylmenaquinone methyltransferase/2-methoxy-6-polyprenyl-1,4-benzoquinol methylase
MTKPPSRADVDTMFNALSPTYDKINRLMTFGLDMHWRRSLVRFMPQLEHVDVLDIATGTGDQLRALLRKARNLRSAVGIDFAEEMLTIAEKKIAQESSSEKILLMKGDAHALPFPDAHFDCVTISFGIRNMIDVPRCLQEMRRVLRPGGKALILECSIPQQPWVRIPFIFYFRHIMPRIAGWLSGQKAAYRYLNETAETFPCGEAFCALVKAAGFVEVKAHSMALGAITLYESIW